MLVPSCCLEPHSFGCFLKSVMQLAKSALSTSEAKVCWGSEEPGTVSCCLSPPDQYAYPKQEQLLCVNSAVCFVFKSVLDDRCHTSCH